ncbi:MAG TPA: response regulator transcription factor [Acidobacteriota bacterium]|nr:response regulator transcription factor [Acidobacteriota bacterium]HMZ78427.1 response regulator transcription factor [Acidobacteriota bacterium]HNB72405.1 response regulator transcription factor [Acidobacteriota bacterium]HNC44993.1 response regulator transcription factor [Acidobacteriota bacterium]
MIDQITILIVDDHALVRQGVRAFLETEPAFTIVGEAANGLDAVAQCAEYAPDVVLLDLLMPGMNGVEAARHIKQVSPKTQIVILTSYQDDDHILPAIRAGAVSYLLKDIEPAGLSEAVRKAAQGEVTMHPQIAAKMIQLLQQPPGASTDGEFAALTDLSKRELEVLELIANGLSNLDIGNQLFISEKTVKSHVSNILSKLHLADRTQAAVFAWRKGIIKA